MSLKNTMILMLVLVLVFSLLPLEAAAQETTGATEPTEAPAEKKTEIPWAVTALILALITTFLQNKFIHGRK